MARSVRVEYEGAWYHLMARGNRREAIFEGDADRTMMLATLGQACGRTGWQVHAWALMSNHFHFVIRTPKGNLVEGMKWFMNTFTRRFNTRHKRWGRLFGDRYKALLIEPPEHAGDADYLREVLWYVHLNPLRAGLISRCDGGGWRWDDYRWSSMVGIYGQRPGARPEWCLAQTGLALEGLTDSARGRRSYIAEANRRAEEWSAENPARRMRQAGGSTNLSSGWFSGGEAFKEWLIEQVGRKLAGSSRRYRSSDQGRDFGMSRARQLIAIACECFGWARGDVASLPRGEPGRVLLAAEITRQTSVGQQWIAEALGMKTAANVSQQIRRNHASAEKRISARLLRQWRTKSIFVD